MNLTEKSYRKLFPNSTAKYIFSLKYSSRFKDYGANIRLAGNLLETSMSKQWIGISEEIQMGLIQELICKLLKKRTTTTYIDLYNSFVKNLHLAIPKELSDPLLEESFNRVNQQYFLGLVEQPNLKWGRHSIRTFGSYDFKNDTVTISKIFKDQDSLLTDFIMFHEVLHKQRKFRRSGSKTFYHDAKFKRAERIFKNAEIIEKRLNRVARNAKFKAFFRR